MRWHGQGLQQVTGFSEGRDWGRIISEHSVVYNLGVFMAQAVITNITLQSNGGMLTK